MKMHGPKSKIT